MASLKREVGCLPGKCSSSASSPKAKKRSQLPPVSCVALGPCFLLTKGGLSTTPMPRVSPLPETRRRAPEWHPLTNNGNICI